MGVGFGVAQHLEEDLLVQPAHVQEVHPGDDRPAPEGIGGLADDLVTAGQEAQERRAVVLGEVVEDGVGLAHVSFPPAGPGASPPVSPSGSPSVRPPASMARPSSRSRAVGTSPVPMPRRTMVKATSGWMPTMTVRAP